MSPQRSDDASADDVPLVRLMRAIAARDPAAMAAVERSPDLCRRSLVVGASRTDASTWFLLPIEHYINAGDTALHVAAATYDDAIARALIRQGAAIAARNRLGAQPLHYACDGAPGLPTWDPTAQASMVGLLVASGADPNATDKRGVTPLHRAVRARCTGAVRELLVRGADSTRRNGSGSTPLELATGTTGRGGSGTPEAKREQRKIIDLLREHGAR